MIGFQLHVQTNNMNNNVDKFDKTKKTNTEKQSHCAANIWYQIGYVHFGRLHIALVNKVIVINENGEEVSPQLFVRDVGSIGEAFSNF